jgi:hypothetical protein
MAHTLSPPHKKTSKKGPKPKGSAVRNQGVRKIKDQKANIKIAVQNVKGRKTSGLGDRNRA